MTKKKDFRITEGKLLTQLEQTQEKLEELYKQEQNITKELIKTHCPVQKGDIVIVFGQPDDHLEVVQGEVSGISVDKNRGINYDPEEDRWESEKGWSFCLRVKPYVKDLSRPKYGYNHKFIRIDKKVRVEIIDMEVDDATSK